MNTKCSVQRWDDVHSKKGIIEIKPLSPGLPSHFGKMMAFSGCADACSGCVSRRMTFDKSRFKYVKSCNWHDKNLDAEGGIEINTHLDRLAIYRSSSISEQLILYPELIWVKFLYDWQRSLGRIISAQVEDSQYLYTHVMVLSRKYDDFVKLGEVRNEVIDSRTLRCPPAVLTLDVQIAGQSCEDDQVVRVLTSHVEVTRRSSMESRRV